MCKPASLQNNISTFQGTQAGHCYGDPPAGMQPFPSLLGYSEGSLQALVPVQVALPLFIYY